MMWEPKAKMIETVVLTIFIVLALLFTIGNLMDTTGSADPPIVTQSAPMRGGPVTPK